MRRWLPLLAILLAVLIGGHGVFSQAHLAFGHQPHQAESAPDAEPACTAPDIHGDCPICRLIHTGSVWTMPAPAPASVVFLTPVADLPAPPVAGLSAGIVIRWSLARGPPSIG